MSNFMIDSPRTQHFLLKSKADFPKNRKTYPPLLTSEMLTPERYLTIEQQLTQYVRHAYPSRPRY
jgi:hypothetical protein